MVLQGTVLARPLGRFLQTDPIGYDDQINLYAYVGNDPVNSRDPTGKEICAETCQKIGKAALKRAAIGLLDGPEPGPADIIATVLAVKDAIDILTSKNKIFETDDVGKITDDDPRTVQVGDGELDEAASVLRTSSSAEELRK